MREKRQKSFFRLGGVCVRSVSLCWDSENGVQFWSYSFLIYGPIWMGQSALSPGKLGASGWGHRNPSSFLPSALGLGKLIGHGFFLTDSE